MRIPAAVRAGLPIVAGLFLYNLLVTAFPAIAPESIAARISGATK